MKDEEYKLELTKQDNSVIQQNNAEKLEIRVGEILNFILWDIDYPHQPEDKLELVFEFEVFEFKESKINEIKHTLKHTVSLNFEDFTLVQGLSCNPSFRIKIDSPVEKVDALQPCSSKRKELFFIQD